MHLLQHGQPGRKRLMSYLESPNDCSLTPLSLQDLLLLIFSPVGTCFFLFPFQKVSFTCFHIVSKHVSLFPRHTEGHFQLGSATVSLSGDGKNSSLGWKNTEPSTRWITHTWHHKEGHQSPSTRKKHTNPNTRINKHRTHVSKKELKTY